LGLAEKDKVGGKRGVINKDTNKKAYKLKVKELLIHFCNTV
jgi:hypothetical protein